MKNTFSVIYKKLGYLIWAFLLPFLAPAQDLPKGILEERLNILVGEDSVAFHCISVIDSMATLRLSNRLRAENYPLTMLTREQYTNYFKLLENLSNNLTECQQLEQNYAVMDGLNALREKKLFELIELEKKRANMFKEAQEEIRKDNKRLSEQLQISTEIANKNLKGRLRKNLTLGILGGVAGFTTGILIGVLATK